MTLFVRIIIWSVVEQWEAVHHHLLHLRVGLLLSEIGLESPCDTGNTCEFSRLSICYLLVHRMKPVKVAANFWRFLVILGWPLRTNMSRVLSVTTNPTGLLLLRRPIVTKLFTIAD